MRCRASVKHPMWGRSDRCKNHSLDGEQFCYHHIKSECACWSLELFPIDADSGWTWEDLVDGTAMHMRTIELSKVLDPVRESELARTIGADWQCSQQGNVPHEHWSDDRLSCTYIGITEMDG